MCRGTRVLFCLLLVFFLPQDGWYNTGYVSVTRIDDDIILGEAQKGNYERAKNIVGKNIF